MFRRIMVGIDGSQIAVSALAEAIRLATMDGAAIHAVSVVESVPDIVWPGPGFNDPAAHNRTTRATANAALARAHDLFILTNLAGETSLLDADDTGIASQLQRQSKAWGADLMVLGTHGRSGVERILLGSTAESFLRSADIPVLIVPLRNHAESSREVSAVVSPPAV
ncbi:universal stress protein (plasmid) [Paraburkholderia sp. PGU19]|uniref:universal stress protein n=1 Tax=Paraburkholderia sp. PGU19 TaxID=2735434 RepID=UPI0015D99142|nr:universal stress protein [Paraburkholderia sp. PGU19]BCG04664.1 universal stress protein [Paraburkholderia sp. PGU19]